MRGYGIIVITTSPLLSSICSEVKPNDRSYHADPRTLNVPYIGKILTSSDYDSFDIYVSSVMTIRFELIVPAGLDYEVQRPWHSK
jgi:hypothetical protein